VSFAAIAVCAASQRVFIVVVYFVIESVQKLLNTPSYQLTVMQEVFPPKFSSTLATCPAHRDLTDYTASEAGS
jgi:hypothetical protein